MRTDLGSRSDIPFSSQANAIVAGGYAPFVDAIAWHWYNMPGNLGLNFVGQTAKILPGVPMLATEACYLQSLTETVRRGRFDTHASMRIRIGAPPVRLVCTHCRTT